MRSAVMKVSMDRDRACLCPVFPDAFASNRAEKSAVEDFRVEYSHTAGVSIQAGAPCVYGPM